MSNFLNTVDSVGDESLTRSIINRSITEIADISVEKIGDNAFNACANLTAVDFPTVSFIGNGAFHSCADLKTANFSSVITIRNNAFYKCKSLTTVVFPAAKTIYDYAFGSCNNLIKADFPVVSMIRSYAFSACTSLTTLILRNPDSICTLYSINALNSTPIASGTGYIYVPAALVDSYKSASKWSTYANQFRAIEDYPDVCGT